MHIYIYLHTYAYAVIILGYRQTKLLDIDFVLDKLEGTGSEVRD